VSRKAWKEMSQEERDKFWIDYDEDPIGTLERSGVGSGAASVKALEAKIEALEKRQKDEEAAKKAEPLNREYEDFKRAHPDWGAFSARMMELGDQVGWACGYEDLYALANEDDSERVGEVVALVADGVPMARAREVVELRRKVKEHEAAAPARTERILDKAKGATAGGGGRGSQPGEDLSNAKDLRDLPAGDFA
jgi:hypothetical protein